MSGGRRLAWEEIPKAGDVYSARTGFALVNSGGSFYLFGGTDGSARQSDVYHFETDSLAWNKVATNGSAPAGRSGAQAIVFDDAIWLFGGYTRKDGEYFNDVYKLHIPSGRWTAVQAIGEPPAKRTDHSLVRYGSSMYVFGGFDGRTRYNDLVELSLEDWRWTLITTRTPSSEPRTRFAHASVVHHNSMYTFGGWDGHDTLQEVFEYSFPSKTWTPLAPRGSQPSPRYRHSAVVGGDCMFTFGGVDKAQQRFQDLYCLNLTERLWTEVSTDAVPSARTFHKTVVHDGYLYILGGFDGRRQNDAHRIRIAEADAMRSAIAGPAPGDRGTANGELRATAEGESSFVPEDMWRWQALPVEGEAYSPRTGHAVVVWGNYFFVFGGTDETARHNDIYMYETNSARWSILQVTGDAPSARSGAKACIYRDGIYFIGGYTKKDGEYFNDLYRLDIVQRHWSRVHGSGAPSPRTDHTCVVYGPCLYVFGGFDGKSRFSDVYKFDMDEVEWSLITGVESPPVGRFGHSAVIYGSSMYIFGGWNGHDTMDDLSEFNTTTLQWFTCPGRGNVPSSRYRHSAAVYGCCMFVFGGVDKRQARFQDFHEFNFEQRTWSYVETSGEVPTARTFHQALIHSGCMYLLGGFDGMRRNDMYRIPLPEELPQDEIRRRRRAARERDGGQAPDEDEGADLDTEAGRIRAQIFELQMRLEREQERHICKMCYDREIDAVILPCSHRVVCFRCGQQLRQCPWKACRRTADRVLQTYDG